MEKWEKRYIHYRDYRNARCKSAGVEIPIDPHYGAIAKMTREAEMQFSGPKFWPIFEEMGHDSTEFDCCKCNNREDKFFELAATKTKV